jgi:membrane protease YdiL (CAAX protease family)
VSHHLAPPAPAAPQASASQRGSIPHQDARRSVVAFLALVSTASMVVAVLLPRSSAAPLVSAFLPVAVLILLSPFQGRSVWKGLGLNRAGLRLWPIAVAVPLAVAATGYGIAWGRGLVEPNALLEFSAVSLLINASVTTVLVLGEELGWRGYLLPRLQQLTSGPGGAILTAIAHAAVHLPLIVLTSTYNNVGSRWVIAPLSMVTITGAGIFYAWLRDTTHSLWPAAVAHAMGNTVLGLLPAAAPTTAAVPMAYLADEGGVVTALTLTAIAATTLIHARRHVWRTPAPIVTYEMGERHEADRSR